MALTQSRIEIGDVDLEIHRGGEGPPLLFLHGGGLAPRAPFFDLLCKKFSVVAPVHPGFGTSSLPFWMDSVDDFTHVQLALMEKLDLKNVTLVGASLGGWVAADLCTKNTSRVARLAEDERPILDALLDRIDAGRDQYGPWKVDDGRDYRAEAFAEAHRPEVVLRLGARWASKVVAAHLAPADQVVVDPTGRWSDPELAADLVVRSDPGGFCRAVAAAASTMPSTRIRMYLKLPMPSA